MIFNKSQGKFLHGVIVQWADNKTITPEIAEDLRQSFSIRSFDWKNLAKYSFWVALICLIIAIVSAFNDVDFLIFLRKFFDMTYIMRCVVLAICAALVFCFGLLRRRKKPTKIFSNEAIFFLGVLFCAGSILCLGAALSTGSNHFSLLLLLASVVYGILGLALSSKLIWVFSILSLASWYGAETGYISGWGAYYLGMNYPLRFVLFGVILIAGSFGLEVLPKI